MFYLTVTTFFKVSYSFQNKNITTCDVTQLTFKFNQFQGKETEMYSNALSMYLLKNGKWHIPKECINKSFDHRSIEYIVEEVI